MDALRDLEAAYIEGVRHPGADSMIAFAMKAFDAMPGLLDAAYQLKAAREHLVGIPGRPDATPTIALEN